VCAPTLLGQLSVGAELEAGPLSTRLSAGRSSSQTSGALRKLARASSSASAHAAAAAAAAEPDVAGLMAKLSPHLTAPLLDAATGCMFDVHPTPFGVPGCSPDPCSSPIAAAAGAHEPPLNPLMWLPERLSPASMAGPSTPSGHTPTLAQASSLSSVLASPCAQPPLNLGAMIAACSGSNGGADARVLPASCPHMLTQTMPVLPSAASIMAAAGPQLQRRVSMCDLTTIHERGEMDPVSVNGGGGTPIPSRVTVLPAALVPAGPVPAAPASAGAAGSGATGLVLGSSPAGGSGTLSSLLHRTSRAGSELVAALFARPSTRESLTPTQGNTPRSSFQAPSHPAHAHQQHPGGSAAGTPTAASPIAIRAQQQQQQHASVRAGLKQRSSVSGASSPIVLGSAMSEAGFFPAGTSAGASGATPTLPGFLSTMFSSVAARSPGKQTSGGGGGILRARTSLPAPGTLAPSAPTSTSRRNSLQLPRAASTLSQVTSVLGSLGSASARRHSAQPAWATCPGGMPTLSSLHGGVPVHGAPVLQAPLVRAGGSGNWQLSVLEDPLLASPTPTPPRRPELAAAIFRSIKSQGWAVDEPAETAAAAAVMAADLETGQPLAAAAAAAGAADAQRVSRKLAALRPGAEGATVVVDALGSSPGAASALMGAADLAWQGVYDAAV